MNKSEIFKFPTVKQVIFQITFPNLFFIESKIGDIQQKIMEKFPESQLISRKQVVFADLGPNSKIEELLTPENDIRKIWTFTSINKYKLSITSDSLSVVSDFHKTYRSSDNSDENFRDILLFTLGKFFEIISLPIIKRIGLRYIDNAPIFEQTNESIKKYYNLGFPFPRFDFSDVEQMDYQTTVKRDDCMVIYKEQLIKDESNTTFLRLDYDAFTMNIEPAKYLETTDKLYSLINSEWKNTINEPLKEYMRKGEP